MGLRWMVSPSLPLFISLSPPILPLSPPTLPTLFQPASLNYCHGQATTSGEAVWMDGRVGCGRGGSRRKMCIMDVMRGGDSCWHTSTRYMFTGVLYVCACVCACAAVCLCDMPMWQSLATRRCCCSNDAVATTVWHLWRINIFHLDESYYPPLVVVEIQKKKLSSCSDCSAMFHLQHFTVKIRQTAFC